MGDCDTVAHFDDGYREESTSSQLSRLLGLDDVGSRLHFRSSSRLPEEPVPRESRKRRQIHQYGLVEHF